jgi:hypothetical protein
MSELKAGELVYSGENEMEFFIFEVLELGDDKLEPLVELGAKEFNLVLKVPTISEVLNQLVQHINLVRILHAPEILIWIIVSENR